MAGATTAVVSLVSAILLLSWNFFRRYAVARPSFGVFNQWDLSVVMGGIILVPYLYLVLPAWLVVALLTLTVLSVLYLVWEPVLSGRYLTWLIVLTLIGGDFGAALLLGTASKVFFAINNLVLVCSVVGITNLWAQSGMKARQVALLAGFLTVYDAVMTWQLSHMAELFARLFGLPLVPVVAWPLDEEGQWIGLGIGDLMLAAVSPLVMRKAFGLAAGRLALILNLGLLLLLLALAATELVRGLFPVMLALGPLTLLQYWLWRSRCGPERTMQ